jgi:hypothetical protein
VISLVALAFGKSLRNADIMDALMQGRGQTKVRDAVRRRVGKEPASEKLGRAPKSAKPTGTRRSVH